MRWILLVIAMMLAIAGGCAPENQNSSSNNNGNDNSPGTPAPSEGPTGYIAFRVEWPSGSSGSLANALIDPETQWIRVLIEKTNDDDGVTHKELADITPSSTSHTATVPVGTYRVWATTWKEEHGGEVWDHPLLLGYGGTTATVSAGETTQAQIVVAGASASLVSPTPPAIHGSTPEMQASFTNWPQDLEHEYAQFFYLSSGEQSLTNVEICQQDPSPEDIWGIRGRECSPTSPLPDTGSEITFGIQIHASRWLRDFGGGPTLFPEDFTPQGTYAEGQDEWTPVFFPTMSLVDPDEGSLNVSIE